MDEKVILQVLAEQKEEIFPMPMRTWMTIACIHFRSLNSVRSAIDWMLNR